ncbi:MAG: hypothetical protein U0354_00955 [Candidatus Sericytochromatia bacterium]
MNKHAIILPMILTSAISLHALSFYIEEPEEIVENPTPINTPVEPNQSPVTTESNGVQVATNPSSTTQVNVNVQTSAAPNTTVKTTETKTTVATNTQTQATNAPQNNTTSTANTTTTTTTTTTTESPAPENTIQVAAALIPTKNYDDMVKEAKQIGGRVDPFVSMKPPEAEPIPELPEVEKTTTTTKVASIPKMPTFANKVPAFIPEPPIRNNTVVSKPPKVNKVKPNTSKITIAKNTTTTNKTVKTSDGKTIVLKPNEALVKNPNGTTTTTTINTTETIVTEPIVRIDEGLELNGIITGNKKLALIKVDDDNRVFGVGEFIRKEDGIKIVSIDYENDTVTISDSKNRRARLEIK